MAFEERGAHGSMQAGVYSLMGILAMIPVLQEIHLEKKYNEAKNAREKAAFHPDVIARHARRNPMGLFWADHETLDPIREKLIQHGIPFVIVRDSDIQNADIHPVGPFAFVVRGIDQERVEKIIRDILKEQQKEQEEPEEEQEEEIEREEDLERERTGEDERQANTDQDNSTKKELDQEQPDFTDEESIDDSSKKKQKKKTAEKKKKPKKKHQTSYQHAHVITQEQIRKQLDDIRQLERDRRALEREKLLQQQSENYYKQRTELNDRERDVRRRDEETRRQQIKELERKVEERRKITEARNDKFSSQGYTGWKDFAADAQERVRKSSDTQLQDERCYQGMRADDYLKRTGSGDSAVYQPYTQEERVRYLDHKYGEGSETKINLNGYAREREALEIARQKEELLRAKESYDRAVRENHADQIKASRNEYDRLKQTAHVNEERIRTWNAAALRQDRERLEQSLKERTDYLEKQKISGYQEYGNQIANRVRTTGVGAYTAGNTTELPKPEHITDASGNNLNNFTDSIYNAKRQDARASEKDWTSSDGERLYQRPAYHKMDKSQIYGMTTDAKSELNRRLAKGQVYAMTWDQVKRSVDASATRAAMNNPEALIRAKNPQYGDLIETTTKTYNPDQVSYSYDRKKEMIPDTPVTKPNSAPKAGGGFHITPGFDAGRPMDNSFGKNYSGQSSDRRTQGAASAGRQIDNAEARTVLMSKTVDKRTAEQKIDLQKVRARNHLSYSMNNRYFTMAVGSVVRMGVDAGISDTEAGPVIRKAEAAIHFGAAVLNRSMIDAGIKAIQDSNPMIDDIKSSLLNARSNMAMRMDEQELAKYAEELKISPKQLQKAQSDPKKMNTLLQLCMTNTAMSKADMLEMADAFGIAGTLAKDGIVGEDDCINFAKKINDGYTTIAQQARAYDSVMESMSLTTATKKAEDLLKQDGELDVDGLKNILKDSGFSEDALKNLEGKFGNKDELLAAIQGECANKEKVVKALLDGHMDPADLRELLIKNGVSEELINKLGGNFTKTEDLMLALKQIGLSDGDVARMKGAIQNIAFGDGNTAIGMIINMHGGHLDMELLQKFGNAGFLTDECMQMLQRYGKLEEIPISEFQKLLKTLPADPAQLSFQQMITIGIYKSCEEQKAKQFAKGHQGSSLRGLMRHVRRLFMKLGENSETMSGLNLFTNYAHYAMTITKASYRLLYNMLFKHIKPFKIGKFEVGQELLRNPVNFAGKTIAGKLGNTRIASVFSKPIRRITHGRLSTVVNHVMHPGRTAYSGINFIFQKIFHKSLGQTLLGKVAKKVVAKWVEILSSGIIAKICGVLVVIAIIFMIYEDMGDDDSGINDDGSTSYSAAYVSAADGKDAFAQEVIDMLRGYTDDFIDEINNAQYNRGMYSTMIDYNVNETVGNYENGAYRIVFRGPDGNPIENIRDVDLNNSKDIISMASVFIPTIFQKPGDGASEAQKEEYEKDKEHFKDYCSFLWAASHQISIEEYHPGNSDNPDAEDESGLETDPTTGKCKMDYATNGDQGAGVNWWLGQGTGLNFYIPCSAEADKNASYLAYDYEFHNCVEKPTADPCTHGHWELLKNEDGSYVKYTHKACTRYHGKHDKTCEERHSARWDKQDQVYQKVWVCDGHMGAVVYVTIGKISRMPNFGAATDWDFTGGETFGGSYGGMGINGTEAPFQATGYPELTDAQLKYLAGMCIQEQGACATNPTTMRYQASLMANVYELYGKKHNITIWQYLNLLPGHYLNGATGWFATETHTKAYEKSKSVTDECFAAIKDVLVNGNRITHANEQGTLGKGFTKVVYNGQTFTGNDLFREDIWVPGETLVYTSKGQECIFLAMPGGKPGKVDPFALIKN